jgi:hypothetical protein
MTDLNSPRPGNSARRLTWTLLVAVPVLGIAVLGSNVIPSLASGPSPVVPGGLLVSETREFAKRGDDVTALTAREPAKDVDQFLNDWQNTVRRRASPRR